MSQRKASKPTSPLLTQEALLNRMTYRIRQSLDLMDILSATVAEMRSFLQTDRVKVYRFAPDGTGEVIAESIYHNHLPSLLGLHFPAADIPPHARELFVKAGVRTIVNVASEQMTLNYLENPKTTADLTVQEVRDTAIADILQRPVDPCHVEYLTNMGVQSTLVVPILNRQKLWGLLISHHAQPKPFSPGDLEVAQLVANQVSIAISQSTLLSQAESKAQREILLNQIATQLHGSWQVSATLPSVLEQTVAAVGGSGGRLYLPLSEPTPSIDLYTCGTQPGVNVETIGLWQQMKPAWDAWTQQKQTIKADLNCMGEENSTLSLSSKQTTHPVFTITDLYQEPLLAEVTDAFQDTPIRSLLLMPLGYGKDYLGVLTLFRDEIETDILWAGRFDPDERNDRVRQSFEEWREIKQGQVNPWTEADIHLIQSLGLHLSMAVMQSQLYQREKQLNTELEARVRQRTAALTQANQQLESEIVERQHTEAELLRQNQRVKLLVDMTQKIRQSLQIEEVLQTTVKEVQKILEADRVIIYQFEANGVGTVVTEAVRPEVPAILGQTIADPCFDRQYQEIYRNGRVAAIANVAQADIQPCYRDLLQQFDVQANLVVPILQRSALWGLLIVHQCQSWREWTSGEIDLLRQLADQVGIALGQAQLLEQEVNQRQELERSNAELEQFAYVASHDLQEPLRMVASYTKLLAQLYQGSLDAEADKFINYAVDGAERMQTLLNDLLLYSRVGRKGKAFRLTDSHAALDSAIANLQMIIQETDARVTSHTLPSVMADETQLVQLFQNLISNAIKYRSQQPPVIDVGARLENGEWCFWVKDNGIGIAPKHKERIFIIFQRLHTRQKYPGTGIGLAICKKIVERHRGRIWVESEFGQGATFYFTIPDSGGLCR